MSEKSASQEKKPGIFSRTAKFFRDQKGETKKIVWPSKKQVINNTGIVIVAVAMFSVVVGAFDWVFGQLIKLLLGA